MNENIMKAAGFGEQVELVKNGKCPFCKKDINGKEDFNDELFWEEYKISGLCQKCQDEIFG